MANLEERMRQYAEKQGISVEELRKRLDAEMQKKAGPTFEEGVQVEHHVIIKPSTNYHRSRDLLNLDTDLMTLPEATEAIDQAMDRLGVNSDVLAIMELAVKVPPKYHSKKRKGEGWDPLFGINQQMRRDVP